jgi:uncharacterized protein YjbJ (UPF0337 family)
MKPPGDFTLAVHSSPGDTYESNVLLARARVDGTLELLTAGWQRMLGYRRRELDGKTLGQLMGSSSTAAAHTVVAILDERNMDPVDLTLLSRAGEARGLRLHRRHDEPGNSMFIVAEEAAAPAVRAGRQTAQRVGLNLAAITTRNKKMNWDRIEGNWKQFKGNAMQQWGKLTDDQLDMIAGKRDVLLGRIQELYGISKDETEKQLADWEKRMQGIGLSNETTVVPGPK